MGCTCGKNQKVIQPKQKNQSQKDKTKDLQLDTNNITNKPDKHDIESLDSVQQRQIRHSILQSKSIPNPNKFQLNNSYLKNNQNGNILIKSQQDKGVVEEQDLINDADENLFLSKEQHINKIKMKSVPVNLDFNKNNTNNSPRKNFDLVSNQQHQPFEATEQKLADQQKQNKQKINCNKIAPDLVITNDMNQPLDTEHLEETQQIACKTPQTIKKSQTKKIVPLQKSIPNEAQIFSQSNSILGDSILQEGDIQSYAVLQKKGGSSTLAQSSIDSNLTFIPKRLQQNSLINNDDLMIKETQQENNQMDEDFSECEEKSQYSNFQVPKVGKNVNNIEKFQKTDSIFGHSPKLMKQSQKSFQKNNDSDDSFDVFSQKNLGNNQFNRSEQGSPCKKEYGIGNEFVVQNQEINQQIQEVDEQTQQSQNNICDIMFIRETRDGRVESKVKFDELNLSDYQGDAYEEKQREIKKQQSLQIQNNAQTNLQQFPNKSSNINNNNNLISNISVINQNEQQASEQQEINSELLQQISLNQQPNPSSQQVQNNSIQQNIDQSNNNQIQQNEEEQQLQNNINKENNIQQQQHNSQLQQNSNNSNNQQQVQNENQIIHQNHQTSIQQLQQKEPENLKVLEQDIQKPTLENSQDENENNYQQDSQKQLKQKNSVLSVQQNDIDLQEKQKLNEQNNNNKRQENKNTDVIDSQYSENTQFGLQSVQQKAEKNNNQQDNQQDKQQIQQDQDIFDQNNDQKKTIQNLNQIKDELIEEINEKSQQEINELNQKNNDNNNNISTNIYDEKTNKLNIENIIQKQKDLENTQISQQDMKTEVNLNNPILQNPSQIQEEQE